MGAKFAVAGLAIFIVCRAYALGPHEVALLVNQNSKVSCTIANHFVAARDVPPQNIVYLDLPAEPQQTLSAEQFTRTIWEPATRVLEDRRVTGHILAWVYSAGFPTLVQTKPPTSLCGVTFVRNRLPSAAEIEEGRYVSPLFAGPDREGGPRRRAATFSQLRRRLGEAMPLPSMMLGVVATNGSTAGPVIDCIRSGVRSDATAPSGTVYFVANDNVRARARAWQFEGARDALGRLGIEAVVSSNAPSRVAGIVGLQLGVQHVRPRRFGTFRPGCVADHLTSFAGAFHRNDQTKLTAWIDAGATASAGTVTEPRAIWTKFPSAWFYVYYGSGLTVMESFYHATLSPLQTLMVGEPLASPWSTPSSLTLVALEEGAVKGKATFVAQAWTEGHPVAQGTYRFYLDGRPVGPPSGSSMLSLDTTSLSDGYHQLRAVQGAPHPCSSALDFEVTQQGRAVELSAPENTTGRGLSGPLTLTVSAMDQPITVGLLQGERVLDTRPASEGSSFSLDPDVVGYGPVVVQGLASYADGMQVRSRPLPLTFVRP
jgi:uncharacterized protein (TIGR03790 family)